MKHKEQIKQKIWKIEVNRKLDPAIIETSLRLASLQGAQGNTSEGSSLLIRSIIIGPNKATISFTGNKKIVDVFSQILAAGVPDIKIKSSEV